MTNDLALNLIKARESSGFSQRDVAHLLGVSQSVLCKVESGQRMPSLHLATGFAILFGCSMDELLADLNNTSRANIAARLLCIRDNSSDKDRRSMRAISLQRLRERLDAVNVTGGDGD